MTLSSASTAINSSAAPPAAGSATAMTPMERRSSFSLAGIFGLRMLGLFLVLPVFALEARKYPGGDDPALIGLAMGIYGLTQGLLQIPFGLASDRLGRKRVIVFGLLLFVAGSLVAALATSVQSLLVGRALQGAGAISAAVTALLADQTRDAVRTKAMALVGGSIALMFSLSLVVAPLLASHVGLNGLFALTAGLALAAAAAVVWVVPPEPVHQEHLPRGRLRDVLGQPALWRLNFGVFVLHAVQLAMWMAVPGLLVAAGLPHEQHGWVYLPAVLASFLVMGLTLFPLEKRGHLKAVFISAIMLIGLVQAGLAWSAATHAGVFALAFLLFLFFCGFNVLEASQPSLASRLAPGNARGIALGVYNTLQSLGLFTGGLLGGWLPKNTGVQGLFAVCGVGTLVWMVVACSMRVAPPKAR